jgi:hypothetical protein
MMAKNPFHGTDTDPFEGARDNQGGIRKEKPSGNVSKKSFREAFAEARKAGDKNFTWNGKKYTTEVAKPKPTPKVAEKRDFPTPTESGRPGPTRAAALNVNATRKDAETAGDKRFVKDTVRDAEKTRERKRMQDDIDTAAAKRKVSGFAEGGKVRGYGMARGGKKCKIV